MDTSNLLALRGIGLMGTGTKIQWTDNTFNPWRGCAKVHTGCTNCYAEREAKRFPANRGIWGTDGTRVLASEAKWREPLKWNREAEKAGTQTRVFCASLADIFEDWTGQLQNTNGEPLWFHELEPVGGFAGKLFRSHSTPVSSKGSLIPDPHKSFEPTTLNEVRADLFDLIDRTPNLIWQILTKRPENIQRMWCSHANTDGRPPSMLYRDNVHLLYSASDQASLDAGFEHLLACRDLVPVLGLSLEPLVASVVLPRTLAKCPNCGRDPEAVGLRNSQDEPFDYFCSQPSCGDQYALPSIDWVIVGGESGTSARPCNTCWIRDVVRSCKAAGIPCFVKQLGENVVTREHYVDGLTTITGVGGLTRYRTAHKKGGDWDEWPEELRVREFPRVEVHS